MSDLHPRRSRGSETSLVSFGKLSTDQIRKLVQRGMSELLERAIEDEDPDVLVAQAMQSMFSNSGDPLPPTMIAANIVALAGTVRDTSSGKHACSLYTVQMPNDEPPMWSWDSTTTKIHNDHEKVGQIRRSVSIHVTVDDMVIARHDMMWDGNRHIRNVSRAWRVESVVDTETDNVTSILTPEKNYTPTHLPPPDGGTDTRSAKGQN